MLPLLLRVGNRNMQEAAEAGDPDYKRVLEGTNNDPVKVIENVRFAALLLLKHF